MNIHRWRKLEVRLISLVEVRQSLSVVTGHCHAGALTVLADDAKRRAADEWMMTTHGQLCLVMKSC